MLGKIQERTAHRSTGYVEFFRDRGELGMSHLKLHDEGCILNSQTV